MQRYRKVFGIGLNKTGTTSLATALNALGFRSSHWSPALLDLYEQGEFPKLFYHVDRFEAFADWPWPLMVDQLLDTYGDRARFVLTKRPSAEVWLHSLKRHALISTDTKNPRKRIYGYDYPQQNEQAHLDYYERHITKTRALFERRGARHLLLEACWEDGNNWLTLCDFLDKPFPDMDFPHENCGAQKSVHALTALRNLARRSRIETQAGLQARTRKLAMGQYASAKEARLPTGG